MRRGYAEIARRTERMPRAAIARTLAEFYKHPTRAKEPNIFRSVFPVIFAEAQDRGELPSDIDPMDLADMLNDAHGRRGRGLGRGAHDELAPVLDYRARVLLVGVRAEHAS